MLKKILSPGDVAPDFEASLLNGKALKLSRLRGHPVWMIFYRYANCPICNLHLTSLAFRNDILKNINLKVVAIFESPRESFPKTLAGKPYPDVAIVPDPARKLYSLYGAESSLAGMFHPKSVTGFISALFQGQKQGKLEGKFSQLPMSVLIDPDGYIDNIYRGRHAADHIPWETVDNFVERSQIGMWQVRDYI
ncbi:MAG TPA: redoxin domain-containing protein [Bdellovibrionales bacterium]|nr:redoxin domain-containing protein [Bdellovibrionales bacterium]